MDVCVMLLLRQFAVMAYEANRVKLRGLELEVIPGSSPVVNLEGHQDLSSSQSDSLCLTSQILIGILSLDSSAYL